MTQIPGEAQITPQHMQQLTPDVISPQGKQQLFSHLAKATIEKQPLDTVLQSIAQKSGAQFSSRIKNAQTVVQKIAQKRMQGRNYQVNDVNDAYGGRIIVDSDTQKNNVLSAIKQIASQGAFKVVKTQDVKDDTYHAYHIDLQTPQGTKAEVQIMKPQEQLEAMANHGLRAQFGENPDNNVQTLKNRQADLAKNASKEQALQKAKLLAHFTKQNNDKPLDPRMVASILMS